MFFCEHCRLAFNVADGEPVACPGCQQLAEDGDLDQPPKTLEEIAAALGIDPREIH